MLILITILTIVAWRRGWRWKALLPLGVGAVAMFLLGFMIGLSVKASGGSLHQVDGLMAALGIMGDVAVIIALAVMIGKAPRQVQVPAEVQQSYDATGVSPYLLDQEKPVAPSN